MKVKIYQLANNSTNYKNVLLCEINVKNQYESSFYFRNMPTIGERTCKKILNNIYPNFKADGVEFLMEDVETGHRGVQKLYRSGTILNF